MTPFSPLPECLEKGVSSLLHSLNKESSSRLCFVCLSPEGGPEVTIPHFFQFWCPSEEFCSLNHQFCRLEGEF